MKEKHEKDEINKTLKMPYEEINIGDFNSPTIPPPLPTSDSNKLLVLKSISFRKNPMKTFITKIGEFTIQYLKYLIYATFALNVG